MPAIPSKSANNPARKPVARSSTVQSIVPTILLWLSTIALWSEANRPIQWLRA
jgi:hypothetical protein